MSKMLSCFFLLFFFLYIGLRGQAIKVEQGIEFHGGLYIMLSSSVELGENNLLPVALTTSIVCDLH